MKNSRPDKRGIAAYRKSLETAVEDAELELDEQNIIKLLEEHTATNGNNIDDIKLSSNEKKINSIPRTEAQDPRAGSRVAKQDYPHKELGPKVYKVKSRIAEAEQPRREADKAKPEIAKASVEEDLKRTPSNNFIYELSFLSASLLAKDLPAFKKQVFISLLQPSVAARIISSLPPKEAKKLALAIGHEDKIARNKIYELNNELHLRLESILDRATEDSGELRETQIDGLQHLARILNNMEPRLEQDILAELNKLDRKLNISLTKYRGSRNERQKLKRLVLQLEKHELAVLISSKYFRDKFRTTLSKNQQLQLLEELISLNDLSHKELREERHRVLKKISSLQVQ